MVGFPPFKFFRNVWGIWKNFLSDSVVLDPDPILYQYIAEFILKEKVMSAFHIDTHSTDESLTMKREMLLDMLLVIFLEAYTKEVNGLTADAADKRRND